MTNPTLINIIEYIEPNNLEGHNYAIQQNELKMNLDWYDYGARFYDVSLGRFHTIDPHAENYLSWTPYNYVGNNPILLTDPTGMDWYQETDKDGKVVGSGAVMWQKGSNAVDGYKNLGANYTQTLNDGTVITYKQNEAVEMTEFVLNTDDWVSDRPDGTKTKECFEASSEMVKNGYGNPKNGATENTIVTATESGTDKNHSLTSTANANQGMDYIDSQINQGKSVLVGVDYTHGSKNNDNVTDHWVAISSRTINFKTNSKTYNFFDPGTEHDFKGTNPQNTFKKDGSFYIGNYYSKTYTVSGVRKNN